MTHRVFVKVVGFTDVERHALNTVFRLSEQRGTVYMLWMPDAPEAPKLALIDGQSYEASMEMELAHHEDAKLIWVGEAPPEKAWRSFDRPLSWPEVLQSIDELFAPAEPLDFDLDMGTATMEDTRPPEAEEPRKRALIASADLNERLYLRAKLALAELTQADEAATGAQALELARANQYAVAVVDFGLPDVQGWALLKELAEAKPAIPHLIFTKHQATFGERTRAWFGGAKALFDKPPHPGKLQELLQKV